MEPEVLARKNVNKAELQVAEEKGIQFEKWVVKRLPRDFYTIKEWREDKYVDGNYAESTKNPDLEVEFHMGQVRKPFAIECKWRQGYDHGEKPYIVWASERQIENYRSFAEGKNLPVFVVIGLGGNPDDPDEVFIVNLNSLKYPKATAEYLGQFRRRNKELGFYYDYKKPELKEAFPRLPVIRAMIAFRLSRCQHRFAPPRSGHLARPDVGSNRSEVR